MFPFAARRPPMHLRVRLRAITCARASSPGGFSDVLQTRRAGRKTLLQATRLPAARPPSRTVPRRSPVCRRVGREAPPYSWTPGDQAAHRTTRPPSRTATAYGRSRARVRREVPPASWKPGECRPSPIAPGDQVCAGERDGTTGEAPPGD
jgi:hypothetical protein